MKKKMMKQLGYLVSFGLLCVVVLLGSSALMQPDTIQPSSLPVMKTTGAHYSAPQDIYVPLQARRSRMGAGYMAQPIAVQGASGQVLSMPQPSVVRSYGNTGGGAGVASSLVSVSSGRSTIGAVAVPQLPRAIAMRDNRAARPSAVAPRKVAAYKASQKQPTGMVLSTATASADLALGYEAAAAYMGSRSPMKAPPGNAGGDNEGGFSGWLGGHVGDGKEYDWGVNADGTINLDYNTMYGLLNGDGDMMDWENFLAWFEGQDKYVWMPIGDAVPLMLLMALAYTLHITKRKKKQQIV